MGYTTDFSGSLKMSRPVSVEEKEYINLFTSSRRMKRDVNRLMELYQGKNGYPFASEFSAEAIYGNDGEYFAIDDGDCGQSRDNSILDYNTPPGQFDFFDFSENDRRIKEGICQPSLWCQWCINDENELEWDGGEKFYNYIEWLNYLIKHFFERWDIKLNGEIDWSGEDPSDTGKITVIDNNIITY